MRDMNIKSLSYIRSMRTYPAEPEESQKVYLQMFADFSTNL